MARTIRRQRQEHSPHHRTRRPERRRDTVAAAVRASQEG